MNITVLYASLHRLYGLLWGLVAIYGSVQISAVCRVSSTSQQLLYLQYVIIARPSMWPVITHNPHLHIVPACIDKG